MKENYFWTFIKGVFMGLANVIPGVSGGTIAFVTGIYERLIDGITDVGTFLKEFLLKIIGKNKKTHKKIFGLIDFKFFIPLFLGILPAILLFSVLFSNLMESFRPFVFSFFGGLILASAVLIYKKIKKHNALGIIYGIIGLAIGFLVTILPVTQNASDPGFLLILIMGAVATPTMILPGISGAFVVLLFGQLEFMYGAVANIAQKWPYLLTFAAGSVIGVLAFARILSYLLKKYHSYTLFTLTGIMLGALYGPVSDILLNLNGTTDVLIASALALLGIAAIVFLHKLSD